MRTFRRARFPHGTAREADRYAHVSEQPARHRPVCRDSAAGKPRGSRNGDHFVRCKHEQRVRASTWSTRRPARGKIARLGAAHARCYIFGVAVGLNISNRDVSSLAAPFRRRFCKVAVCGERTLPLLQCESMMGCAFSSAFLARRWIARVPDSQISVEARSTDGVNISRLRPSPVQVQLGAVAGDDSSRFLPAIACSAFNSPR